MKKLHVFLAGNAGNATFLQESVEIVFSVAGGLGELFMVEENGSIIARSMAISGSVQCHGRVVFHGLLEGTFSGEILEVGESGRISGEIAAGSIDCAGILEGSVVTDSFSLRRTGRHKGTVETRKLVVEPGAVLDCALQSGTIKGNNPVEEIGDSVREPGVDLGVLLAAFHEDVRPCCMDVPWSERLELYSQLLELLEKGKPLVKVTGESGSGKSTLIDKLQRTLPNSYEVLRVKDQVGSVAAVLHGVAADLGFAGMAEASPVELITGIRAALEARLRDGQRVALLVDDVETMYPATLEGIIRHLTNAFGENEGETALQMILFGSKDMEGKMVLTIVEYFEDETNCQLYLDPLNIKDTADYLRFCLQLAAAGDGSYSTALIPYETIRKIHSLSHGNIAVINRLAEKSLRRAHADGANAVHSRYL